MFESHSLTWSRTTILDVPTRVAQAGGWKFTIDRPYPNAWVLRGWNGDEALASVFYEYKTLKDAKAGAEMLAAQKNEG